MGRAALKKAARPFLSMRKFMIGFRNGSRNTAWAAWFRPR